METNEAEVENRRERLKGNETLMQHRKHPRIISNRAARKHKKIKKIDDIAII